MTERRREIPAKCRACAKPIVRIDDADSKTWFCCPAAITLVGSSSSACDDPTSPQNRSDVLNIAMFERVLEQTDDYSDPVPAGTWAIPVKAAMTAAFLVGVLQDRTSPRKLHASVGGIDVVGDTDPCGGVSVKFVVATEGSTVASMRYHRHVEDDAVDWDR